MRKSRNCYIDINSADRGAASIEKALSHWRRFQFVGGITVALGAVLMAFAVNEYSHLDLSGMATLAVIGIIAAILGYLPFPIGKYIMKKNRYEDESYRMAIHFMTEMGVKNPSRKLTKDPRYMEAFEEVKFAVQAKQAEYGQVLIEDQPVTRLAFRIASLVLRDENTLRNKLFILTHIADDEKDLDYDVLDHDLQIKMETKVNSNTLRDLSFINYNQ
jgi:hypothetical protein